MDKPLYVFKVNGDLSFLDPENACLHSEDSIKKSENLFDAVSQYLPTITGPYLVFYRREIDNNSHFLEINSPYFGGTEGYFDCSKISNIVDFIKKRLDREDDDTRYFHEKQICCIFDSLNEPEMMDEVYKILMKTYNIEIVSIDFETKNN